MARTLFYRIFGSGGRNNTGRITARHRGRRAFKNFSIPFSGYNPPFSVSRYYFSSPSGGHSEAVCSKVSSRRYALSFLPARFAIPRAKATLSFGNYGTGTSLARLYSVPFGSFVSHVQLSRASTATFGCAPGSFVQVLRRRGSFVTLKLPSGEIRRISAMHFALTSTLSARSFFIKKFSKAGDMRRLGVRPSVRGCAINPVDHPHGGRTGESRPSVSPWAILTKGFRTRSRSVNSRFVLRSVQQLKSRV